MQATRSMLQGHIDLGPFIIDFSDGSYNKTLNVDTKVSSTDYSSLSSSITINSKDTTGQVSIKDSSADEGSASWLVSKCDEFVSNNSNFAAAFSSGSLLAEEVLKVTSGPPSELEGRLFELVGEGGIQLMFGVMQHVDRLRSTLIGELYKEESSDTFTSSSSGSGNRSKKLSANQLRKKAYKEEEYLRRETEAAEAASLEHRGLADPSMEWLRRAGFSDAYLEQESRLGLHGGPSRSDVLDSWTANLLPAGSREGQDHRGNLPAGSERRTYNGWEEIFLPAPRRMEKPVEGELVAISELEPWAQMAFPNTKHLNRIQSHVYQCAYNSNENMLICAPTGAGKTNIAMLSFLQLLKQHITNGSLDKAGVKCVYIAPMKALAQEVVAKFSERLAPLGLVVKEFTGDINLTKQEIVGAQILVSTPEKYDVVTRKGGDGSLGEMVNLIIIDEVHLLADDRGAVIETIVARTQRFIESSQKFIRIVGLSATLPNYRDVASFLRVSPSTGLYHFGPQYRPVPLDQTFIGVTEKQRNKRNDMMNQIAYQKMVKALERGKQVMIFVHSRKETSKTIEAMRDLAGKEGTSQLLDNVHNEQYTVWKRQVDKSRSLEVQQLFYKGLGVHHAGMLRADRSMTEQLFECGLIKVLCCTATLAWGVNLPAHTVIIKGTELYDPERGGYVDVGILDVLQIFGRAGRPQYDISGHALLITPHKNLGNYLSMMGHQAPIESSFIKALADHMNAEIVSGTINNIKEAASWLSYTFLFIRMVRNPLVYGISFDDKFDDPQLDRKRLALVTEAAEVLDNAMMIRYDRRTGNLAVTDLGRIASHYYIRHGTIEAFNSMLTPHLSEADALHVLCASAEFDQLKVRPEELLEIDELKKAATIKLKVGVEDTAGKVSVLLQGFLAQSRVKSFTLQSDMNYVAQNAARIARALFEISVKKGWSTMAHHYLLVCKCIDRRMTLEQTPLRQFASEIPEIAIKRLEETKYDTSRLLDLTAREVGELCHCNKHGKEVLQCARRLPWLEVTPNVQPITRGIIRVSLSINAVFEWVDRYHGSIEAFWIWVEDGDNEFIYHSEYLLVHKKQRKERQLVSFTIPIREPLPPQYYIRIISDRWLGSDDVIPVSFQHLILPDIMPPHTDLRDLNPVPVEALANPTFESLYKHHFTHFNPIQSQIFHTLYHTDLNALVGAPTGSGKTIMGELALLRMVRCRPGAKAIYVAPLKALARERLLDWRSKLTASLGLQVLELTGDVTPDSRALEAADVLIVTPEKWDSISRGWQKRSYVSRVELVIIDEIHLLGEDRGPVLEVIVSRMRFISTQTATPIRFIGLSTALANPRDLADWLGIGESGMFNFRPAVRPIPMSIHIQGFPTKAYCPRMATMNKPAYAAILEHSPHKPVLIFVSSRRQTRLTALDLISYCASDDNPKKFLNMPEDEVMAIADLMHDGALKNTLPFGIGIHHAGLDNSDRAAVEELFLNCKIQVLVCTATLAWGVNLPCHLVIVKGTEYFDGKTKRYVDAPVTDVLQMMGRAGRPQFDDTGTACIFVLEAKKNFYKKFLHEPFPVESSLHLQLHDHINAEIANGSMCCDNDCLEWLTWTYYFRRLLVNPSYYGLEDSSPESVAAHARGLVRRVLADLRVCGCIEVHEGAQGALTVAPATLGRVASFYYLDYRTVGLFQSRLSQMAAGGADAGVAGGAADSKKDLCQLARLLCDAYEFSEVPVRHNEENLNLQLAETLVDSLPASWHDNVNIASMDMMLSNTKAFLLLLSHFKRTALPITDYINDTKQVLDNAPRLLNALLDIAAEGGYLSVVLQVATLSQMLYQAVLVYDPVKTDKLQQQQQLNAFCDISQLPGATPALCRQLQQSGVTNLRLLVSQARGGAGGLILAAKQLPTLASSKLLNSLCLFSLRISLSHSGSLAIPVLDGTVVAVPCDTDLELTVTIIIDGGGGDVSANINCSKYHRQKQCSYWLLLACPRSDELVALKRIVRLNGGGRSTNVTLSFVSRGAAGVQERMVCYLLCDAIVGLDIRASFDILTDKNCKE